MKRHRMTLAATAVAAVFFLLTAGAPIASADMFNFSLVETNLVGYPGPYAEVAVNRTDGTHATITFTSRTSSGNIYLLGDGGSVAVNVNAASWTLGSFTGSNDGTGFTPGPLSDGGAGNEDGFGSFNQTINSFDGFTHSADSISFVLTRSGGTWTSAGDVLIANAVGRLAAAHIFVAESPANASGDALATGFATNGIPPSSVPDGGVTLMLLGGALVGLGILRRSFSA